MTCIKTGARVYFANYDMVISADLFAVENTIVVRTNPHATCQTPHFERDQATHVVVSNAGGGNEFWRDDIGVFVVPACNIQPVNHGHKPQTMGNTF